MSRVEHGLQDISDLSGRFIKQIGQQIESPEFREHPPLAKVVPVDARGRLSKLQKWLQSHELTCDQVEALKDWIDKGAEGGADALAGWFVQVPEIGPFLAAAGWLTVRGMGYLVKELLDAFPCGYKASGGLPEGVRRGPISRLESLYPGTLASSTLPLGTILPVPLVPGQQISPPTRIGIIRDQNEYAKKSGNVYLEQYMDSRDIERHVSNPTFGRAGY